MFELLSSPEIWASLATLTILEIILGIDNIIFLSVVVGKLKPEQRPLARRIGLLLALGMRVALLSVIAWVAHLSQPVFTIDDFGVSWRDIIFVSGGLFLLTKGTREIHHMVEHDGEEKKAPVYSTFTAAIIQIVIFDLVFSLDSVITAVGMSDHLPIMITAVVIAMMVMLFAASTVSEFVEKHPTVKMLALSFLLLIGMALVADGMHFHIPREYLYFAVAFSGGVEILNQLVARKKKKSGGH